MVSRRQIHIFTSKWLGRRGGGLSKILNCYYHYKKDKKDGIVKRACTTTSKLNTVRERRTHTKICPPRELPLFYTPYLVYRQAHVTFVINVPMLCAARVKTKDMTGDRKHWKKKKQEEKMKWLVAIGRQPRLLYTIKSGLLMSLFCFNHRKVSRCSLRFPFNEVELSAAPTIPWNALLIN